MPLKLSLRPGEKFVLNGAVVQNGDRRGTLVLQNKASVLREKDIMYLDENSAADFQDEFILRLSEFMSVISNKDIIEACISISKFVISGDYYKALMLSRKLMTYEDERLRDVSSIVPEDS